MSEADTAINLSSTTSKLQEIVEHRLDLQMPGTIPQQSPQTELLMDRPYTHAANTKNSLVTCPCRFLGVGGMGVESVRQMLRLRRQLRDCPRHQEI